jgi:hypothetical protein
MFSLSKKTEKVILLAWKEGIPTDRQQSFIGHFATVEAVRKDNQVMVRLFAPDKEFHSMLTLWPDNALMVHVSNEVTTVHLSDFSFHVFSDEDVCMWSATATLREDLLPYPLSFKSHAYNPAFVLECVMRDVYKFINHHNNS